MGATGATGATEVVSKTAARTPPPTHAGGQDDGSYTNSLKQDLALQKITAVTPSSSGMGGARKQYPLQNFGIHVSWGVHGNPKGAANRYR